MLMLALSLIVTCGIAQNYDVTLTTEACKDHKILEELLLPHTNSTQWQNINV